MERKPCECGCGQIPKSKKARFCPGHNMLSVKIESKPIEKNEIEIMMEPKQMKLISMQKLPDNRDELKKEDDKRKRASDYCLKWLESEKMF